MKKLFMCLALFSMGVSMSYAGGSNSNFSETLPPAAAANSVPISNGYDWSLIQKSSLNDSVVYTATTTVSDNLSTSLSTMTVAGISPTIPSAWFAVGKTIRLNLKGVYSTAATATNWTFGVAIGTVTVVANAASSACLGQTNSNFSEQALLTTVTTGANGSMLGEFDVYASSAVAGAASGMVMVSSAPITAVAGINMNNAQVVFPNFTWSVNTASMTVTAATIEQLN